MLTHGAVVSLATYPNGLFTLALAVGVYLVRYRRKRAGLPRTEFRAWNIAVIFYILVQVYTVSTPWIPPKGGPYAGTVSFWYATYCVVGIAIILLCGLYYVFWMFLLPKWGGYKIRPEILDVEDHGANTHRLVKVPLDEVEKWDEEHDEAGRLRRRRGHNSESLSQGESNDAETKAI